MQSFKTERAKSPQRRSTYYVLYCLLLLLSAALGISYIQMTEF